ncbi:MurR/RpiR family transcriptional regulator [Kiloniella sp. b19]|uniref:MurR/RpiR family transcriptional regulator n=1 Tax=Kiloniella sp. GXU_MW_B19 TaxID=3141326 RepID=UPI0031DE4511
MFDSAPETVEDFNERLIAVGGDLPKRMKQCADFIHGNSERIAFSTVADLAQGAGIQPSAVMRFCQLLGFSGYSEMQKLFRENYSGGWPDYASRLHNLKEARSDHPTALLAEFIEAGRQSLENLTATIDPESFGRAVEVLAEAPMIHLIGFRRAFPVASYLAYSFEKMDVSAILHDGVGKLNPRHAMRKGDVVIAITFSPYSQETIDLAAYARGMGNQVIAITDSLTSPLRRLDVVPLSVSEVDVGAFRGLAATISLAVALSVAVGAARESKEKQALRES